MSDLIPCSVQVLTRNSMPGVERCLDSLREFAEVIVQDGGSTDGTRALAASYPNVVLMDQDPRYLSDEGRITDFAAMRNLSIHAAAYDWIFVVDVDERVDPDLVSEVGEIVRSNVPGVYQAFRRFFIGGVPVMYATSYPALQIRLFHRTVTDGYVKAVHERLKLHAGVQSHMFHAELPVPLPPARELEPKYRRYLRMEQQRVGVMWWPAWIRWILYRNTRSAAIFTMRLLWIWLIPRPGKRLPLVYEWQFIRHSLQTIWWTFPPIVRRAQRQESRG